MTKLICIALIGLVCAASGQTTNRVVHASRIIGTPDAQGVPGYLAYDVEAERTTWESMVLGITAEFPVQDAGTTSATWLDWSGEENDGTQAVIDSQPTRVKDGDKWVLEFDGQDDFVQFADDYSFIQNTFDFAVVAWIYTPFDEGFEERVDRAIGTCGGASANKGIAVGFDNRQLSDALGLTNESVRFSVYRGVGGSPIVEAQLPEQMRAGWNMWTWTADGTNWNVYRNATEIGSGTRTVDLSTGDSNHNLRIGQGSGGAYLLGKGDDVRIYDSGLTAAQIADMYDSTKNLYPEEAP